MAKDAFVKDWLRQIRGSLHRFLAILVITALGVAFFAGLRATGPDMRRTAADYFDRLNFMDFRLLSTVGFNEEDIRALKNVAGLRSVTPAYSLDALVQLPHTTLTLRLHSLSESASAPDAVNRPELLEGRLPENDGECLADPSFMELSGCRLGDTVRVVSGTADPIAEALKGEVFRIVGLAESPLYISRERGPNGVGSGQTDAYLLLPPGAFDYALYTEVYLTLQNPAALSRFDEGYADLLAAARGALEEKGARRAALRYEEIRSEAQGELDAAKKEVAEGERKLDEAQKKLDEARASLDRGWWDYHSGLREYRNEIADAAMQLDEGRAGLDQGWREYAAGADAFEGRISAAEEELAAGRTRYESGLEEYESGLSRYQSGLNAIELARQELEEGEAAYDAGRAEYTRGKELYNALTAALSAGTAPENLAAVAALASELEPSQPELAALLRAYAEEPANPAVAAAAQGAAAQLGQALEQSGRALEAAKAELDEGRARLEAESETLSAAEAGLKAAKAELELAKQQLDEGGAELERARDAGQRELSEAKDKLLASERELAAAGARLEEEEAKGRARLEEALRALDEGEVEYKDGLKAFNDESAAAREELADARQKIDAGEKDLAELKQPEWFVLDHDTNIGFRSYKQDADRIEALSLVVPIFFFLVAALVAMTSMTRLVESDRPHIGTMKALGYGRGKIAMRYLLYAVSASLAGSALGLLAGFNIFPRVIFNAYAVLYSLPPLQAQYIPSLALISSVLAVASAALPAWSVCLHSVREAPAELMRPAAPRGGKRILLERCAFIWRRLNFSRKVAVRNLFRYKKRMWMTIAGVAGGTTLLFTGFGLRDAVTTVTAKQYGAIHNYDMRIDLQQDASAADRSALDAALEGDADILASTKLSQEPVDVQHAARIESAFLAVPETPTSFASFIRFRDRKSGTPLLLEDDAVLITEKLASLLGLAAGDSVDLRTDEGKEARVRIGGVAENYVYHYVFMSPSLYRSLFAAEARVNQVLCQFQPDSGARRAALSAGMLAQNAVTSLTFNTNLIATMEEMVGALHYVVFVLIFSAAALVFVVLFSLSSINLEERGRELATIKVLGFFDRELAVYLFRENVALSIIGTALGLLLGVALQRYVITTMEVDVFMFSRDLLWQSYAYAAGLTLFFATLVNLIMLRYVARIDMVSSLKSVE